MLVVCIARDAFLARSQPVAHLFYFLLDEFLIVKGICQRGDTLAAGKKMHRQRVGVGLAAEQRELPAQPGPKQRKYHVCLGLRSMIQLRKLGTQRPNRAAVSFYLGPVGEQNMDKAPDAIRRMFPFDFPLLQHLSGISQTHIDHGIQNFILGFEVIVKIAA